MAGSGRMTVDAGAGRGVREQAGGRWIVALAAVGGALAAAGGLVLSADPLPAVLLLGGGVVLGVSAVQMLLQRGERPDEWTGLLAQSPVARLVTDPTGRVLFANEAWRALSGGRVEPPGSLFGADPGSVERTARLALRALAGEAGQEELSFGSGAEERIYRLAAEPVQSRPSTVCWSLQDITGLRRERQAWEAERAHFVDFLNGAPTGFYIADESGRIQLANDTLARWIGVTPEELAGHMTLADLFPQDAPRLIPDAAIPPGTVRRVRVLLRGRNGIDRPIEVSETVAPDALTGRPVTRSVVRDMTEQRAWEAALGQAEARFRRFFEVTPVAALTVDREGRVLEANPAFQAMLRAGAAPVGRPFLEMLHRDDRAEAARRLAAARAGAAAEEAIEVRFSEEHDERHVQFFAAPLDADDSGGAELLVNLIDTTQQRQLEQQFAQSQKMQAIGQLAGGVAHDFNNLLTAIIGYCDLLLLRARPGDEFFPDIMQVKQNANRAANLVRQLLAFSRKQTLRPKLLLITDVLVELAHLLRRLIGDNIELRISHGRDLGLVMVDQNQFEQVIINLAVNARDAMEAGGMLEIATRNVTAAEAEGYGPGVTRGLDHVLIEVRDTGKGIPAEDLGKIFEPFFTTKKPEGGAGSGTGLGLSTVYGIVKQTGGAIFADSEVGRGTVFRVLLPIHRAAEGQQAAQPLADEPGRRADLTGKATILLAEDEDAVRAVAVRALKSKGYTVLEARDGTEAIQRLEEQQGTVDLLISDVMMPEMDGPTLMREVRRRWPEVKVIFISGYAEDVFRKSLGQGAEFELLPKPFSLKQLATKVKEVMG